jgi:hypothetical protein
MPGKLHQFGAMSAANLFDHGFFGNAIICQYLQLDEFVVIQGAVYFGIHRIRQHLDDDNRIKLVTDAAEGLAGLIVQAHVFSMFVTGRKARILLQISACWQSTCHKRTCNFRMLPNISDMANFFIQYKDLCSPKQQAMALHHGFGQIRKNRVFVPKCLLIAGVLCLNL